MSQIFPRESLTALTWTFGAIAVTLTAGRYFIRHRYLKDFQADDYIHGLATIFLIAYLAVYTWIFTYVYTVADVGLSGFREWDGYIRSQLVVVALFFATLYTVKLAFLALFYQMFRISQTFRRAWWVVLILTVLAWAASFISNFWWCNDPSNLNPGAQEAVMRCFQLGMPIRLMRLWCPLMVITDVLILILPLWMIFKLNMSLARKIGLAAIFLLVIFNIVLDIMRTVFTVHGTDNGLDSLFDILEATTAVIVSALPAYRALLPKARTQEHSEPAPSYGIEKARSESQGGASSAEQSLGRGRERSFVSLV